MFVFWPSSITAIYEVQVLCSNQHVSDLAKAIRKATGGKGAYGASMSNTDIICFTHAYVLLAFVLFLFTISYIFHFKLTVDCVGGIVTLALANGLRRGGILLIYGAMSGDQFEGSLSNAIFRGFLRPIPVMKCFCKNFCNILIVLSDIFLGLPISPNITSRYYHTRVLARQFSSNSARSCETEVIWRSA